MLGHLPVQGRMSPGTVLDLTKTTPPALQRSPLSLLVPHQGTVLPTYVCCKVFVVRLLLASCWGRDWCGLDLVQLWLLGRNRKPSADHTAIARFPAFPPLPASPRASS